MIGRRSSITRRAAGAYGLLVVGIAAAGWFAYSSIYGTSSSTASGVARTVTVSRGNVATSVSASGNVSAVASSSPSFTTSGTLTALKVSVGKRVQKGQVLATIDATQAKATLASEQAGLKSAISSLAAAQAGGTASQRAQNESSLTSARLQLTSATQKLATDQAAVTVAQKQLTADLLLGCPAASSSTGSTNTASTPSTNDASADTTGGGPSTDTPPAATTPRTTQAVNAGAAPTATTGSTGTVTTKAVTLTGTVNPGGIATTYVFEYGRKASFGSTTRRISAGAGTTAVAADATIGGLVPATTYVYRLVSTNAQGTARGLTQTFTTATTSCSEDRKGIAEAKSTLAEQERTVSQQRQSVAAAQATVDSSVDAASVAQAAAQVTQAKLTVASAAKAVRQTVLRAPISGTITAVNASVGDTVGNSSSGATGATTPTDSSSSGIVTIADLSELQVVAGFAEADATKIKVGQTAVVTLSALPETTVAGKVTAVSPTSTVTSNVVTYAVTIRLIDPATSVRNGMTAEVSVTVASKSNVLQLPSAAITARGNSSSVTVLRNGKQTTASVTTGLIGASTTEILSGVEEGDVIVVPTVDVTASTSTSSTRPTQFGGGFPTGGPAGAAGPP